MNLKILLFILHLGLVAPKNILILLLDDVDDLPATQSMGFPNITSHFKKNGVIYNNAFVTTPICCPSRASIFTGTYQHNHRTLDNTGYNGCDGPNWDQHVAPNSLGKRLQDVGYRTGMFGKYSNNYKGDKVPVGWDDWLGLVGNSVYYNYTINRNGVNERHGLDYKKDYLPELIIETGLKFMTNKSSTAPWCAFLSFPTAHEPFDAAPQYQSSFKGAKPPTVNFPSYNHTGDTGKHWYTRARPPLNQYSAKYNEIGWRRRIQSLQSVDSGFVRIMKAIDPQTTSIIFTSDNGFYFGEWGMILDKRQPYESTIRVPMFASGPLFPKATSLDTVVLNIDIAPTAVDIAQHHGHETTSNNNYTLPFDGVSMVSLLTAPKSRSSFLVEYHGMGNGGDTNECARKNMRCWYKDNTVWYTQPKFDIPDGEKFCFCVDSKNNTYSCERRVSVTEYANETERGGADEDFTDFLYCNFQITGFNEYYDLHKDPFQMTNSWSKISEYIKFELTDRLEKLKNCRGFEECNALDRYQDADYEAA